MTGPRDRDSLDEEQSFLLARSTISTPNAPTATSTTTTTRGCATTTPPARPRCRLLADGAGTAVAPETVARTSATRRVVTGSRGRVRRVASVALAYGLGARLPGQTITGTQPNGAAAGPSLKELRAAVKAAPNDPAPRLALARALMGAQKSPAAIIEFRRAAA